MKNFAPLTFAALAMAALMLTGCGGVPQVCEKMPVVDCQTAQAYQACIVKNTGGGFTVITRENDTEARFGARDVVKTMCGDDDKKGAPYQQVCPAGAACNQGVN